MFNVIFQLTPCQFNSAFISHMKGGRGITSCQFIFKIESSCLFSASFISLISSDTSALRVFGKNCHNEQASRTYPSSKLILTEAYQLSYYFKLH